MEQLNDRDLELMILGDVYRALACADRLPPDILRAETLDDVGLVAKHEMLAPGSVTLSGEGLVLEAFWSPDQLAKAHIRASCNACGDCLTGKEDRCTKGSLLSRKKVLAWTQEEADEFQKLRNRIQSLFRRWEGQGIIDRSPPVTFKDGYPSAALPNKDTWAARMTTKGIERARELVPGTDFAHGPKSLLWSMDEAQRKLAPDWAQQEYVAEGGHL